MILFAFLFIPCTPEKKKKINTYIYIPKHLKECRIVLEMRIYIRALFDTAKPAYRAYTATHMPLITVAYKLGTCIE